MKFQFTPPDPLPEASEITTAALRLAALSEQLACEERTLVNHVSGRAENVAEHTAMLAIVAPAIAEQFYPKLDANLVARYATIHDAVEAYVGDTPTHEITADGQSAKEALELQGIRQLSKDYAGLPGFVRLLKEYEDQTIPEARFVRIIDKWTPYLLHFAEGGATMRGYWDPDALLQNAGRRVAKWKEQYPDFTELLDVRQELTKLASQHLYQ